MSHSTYWKAWGALLAITLAMVFIGHAPLLITGMCLKAFIICWWFMHLRQEKFDFVLYVLGGLFLTAVILYGLVLPDGRMM
jgi:hypothetical protein